MNFNGMKKPILYFLLFIFHFTFCKAQDTVFFKNGEKKIVKIISVDYKIHYTDSIGNQYTYNNEDVKYIHYSDGAFFTGPVSPTPLEQEKLPFVNLAFNVGYSDLIGGYGSTFNDPYDNEYCGFANGSVTANLTLNLRLGLRGWSFTVMSDYIRNAFNANGLLNEYGDGTVYSDAGNYTYNHFAFMGGFTKTWYASSKKSYFGIRFLAGIFCFNFPELSGTCESYVWNPNTQQDGFILCNWNIDHQIITETVYQIGFTFGQYLTRNWNLFESGDLLFGTEEDIGQPSIQITCPPNETLVGYGPGSPNPAPYLAMFNFTAGIAYTFGK
jgi:hypothetical protein